MLKTNKQFILFMERKEIKSLSPKSLKLYFYLINESLKIGSDLFDFTIYKTLRIINEDKSFNFTSSRNSLRYSLRELESNNLICHDKENRKILVEKF
jgi:hypothetical protein